MAMIEPLEMGGVGVVQALWKVPNVVLYLLGFIPEITRTSCQGKDTLGCFGMPGLHQGSCGDATALRHSIRTRPGQRLVLYSRNNCPMDG